MSYELVESVRIYLASNYMFAIEDWIEGCVQYILENETCSEEDIPKFAKEQWLLNNITDIIPHGTLPDLRNKNKYVLNGKYVLQINSAFDIVTPGYQQFLRLKKVNMENVEATTKFEERVKNHRMMKLTMTDGVQNISGIEYKPMTKLNHALVPGCKILIKGPIVCRREIMFLSDEQVELLGGEVTELNSTNSIPAILCAKFGSLMNLEADNNTVEIESSSNQATQPRMEESVPATSQEADFADDDIDFDQLEEIEAHYAEHPAKRPMIDNNPKPGKKFKKMDPTETVNTEKDYPSDADLFMDEDDNLKEIEADFNAWEQEMNILMPQWAPISLNPEPFIYIKQINDLTEENRVGRVFKVKGQIMKLLSKLSVGKDGWSLKCTIVDGSGNIDVDFTSEVLSQVVGYTPEEMNKMKKQMLSQPELKDKAVSALLKAKETLQVLYCIIELTMLDTPKITKLTPFDECHVNLLKKRLQDRNFMAYRVCDNID